MSQAGFVSPSTVPEGTGQTIGAVTADLITLPQGAVAGAYTYEVYAAGFEASNPGSVSYGLVAGTSTTGIAAHLVPGQALDEVEDIYLQAATAEIVVNANNAIVRVTGVAGFTINWKATLDYIFVS